MKTERTHVASYVFFFLFCFVAVGEGITGNAMARQCLGRNL